ncbi:MAG TPA: hypothetical protein VHV75_08330 [Solirubrobacteraceae bacterium]|jgi:hypothetical protein|nr:hypothetical protein [Solirubrobacteraceae bacterium]
MSMCNVLGVLGDDEEQMWETFNATIALADAEHSRLTLAKTCEDGRTYVWVTPFAFGGVYLPPPLESPADASRALARVVEFVPECMPVTTLVLGADTQTSLLKLVRSGHFNALVGDADLLTHCRKLRRELERHGIRAVPVKIRTAEPFGDTIPDHFSSSGHTKDGVLDGNEVSQGLGRSRWGNLRPGYAHRLAGAGGKQR